MIDFQNASFVKLRPVDPSSLLSTISPLIIEGEGMIGAYQGMRDFLVFTTKRIIVVNVQGITGKKKDFTSLPYSKVQAYSVETAGVLDLDSELELWFSGLGKVRLEFVAQANITAICKALSTFILK